MACPDGEPDAGAGGAEAGAADEEDDLVPFFVLRSVRSLLSSAKRKFSRSANRRRERRAVPSSP